MVLISTILIKSLINDIKISEQANKTLQTNFSTWRGHTVGMCRTLTAPGVLYHNYRIIGTPLQSQEGPCRMHVTGCRVGWLGGGLQICPVQLASRAPWKLHKQTLWLNTHDNSFTNSPICAQPFFHWYSKQS